MSLIYCPHLRPLVIDTRTGESLLKMLGEGNIKCHINIVYTRTTMKEVARQRKNFLKALVSLAFDQILAIEINAFTVFVRITLIVGLHHRW